MARMIAFLVLLIPGIIAGFGIKLMRDTFYGILIGPMPALWFQFIAGLIFFILGIGFIAGFILYRDRKKGKIGTPLKQK